MRGPLLYQVPTRVVLHEVAETTGRPPTLDDLPDALLADVAARGFEWLWPLGVWQTGAAGARIARAHEGVRAACAAALPGLREEDLVSSPFAVRGYRVDEILGGDAALERLRRRLHRRGLRLLLDFVPNHTAHDHPWVSEHPEYYVSAGGALDKESEVFATERGPVRLACGRDRYTGAWTDTVQLNHAHAGCRRALVGELTEVARRCDGVRCDMAMLLEPDVQQEIWGERARPADGTEPDRRPFWPEAIARVREARPDFLFVAEVYWGLDGRLQDHGFDHTYDKALYDALRARDPAAVRRALGAPAERQRRTVRFLENHDEARAATEFAPFAHHAAAAVLVLLAPGLRLVHDGQIEGRRVRLPMQLRRRPAEPAAPAIRAFYERLLGRLEALDPELRAGASAFELLPVEPAPGARVDDVLAPCWRLGGAPRLVGLVNFGPAPARGRVRLEGLTPSEALVVRDVLEPREARLEAAALASGGLDLELGPWGARVLEIEPAPPASRRWA